MREYVEDRALEGRMQLIEITVTGHECTGARDVTVIRLLTASRVL